MKLVRQDLPLVKPCWLSRITSLSSMCRSFLEDLFHAPPRHRGEADRYLPLDQVAQSPSQPDLEHFQGRGIHTFSGQPAPVSPHPHDQRHFPQPALVCHVPRPLTIPGALGWAHTPHLGVFPGLGDQEGTEESRCSCQSTKQEWRKAFFLVFSGFIGGLFGFLNMRRRWGIGKRGSHHPWHNNCCCREMERVSPGDGQVWRLGLPANCRSGGWAGRPAASRREAVPEVDPPPSVLPHLLVDPPPLVLLHLWADPRPWAPRSSSPKMVPPSHTSSSLPVVPAAAHPLACPCEDEQPSASSCQASLYPEGLEVQ